jgi:hypothetical protein
MEGWLKASRRSRARSRYSEVEGVDVEEEVGLARRAARTRSAATDRRAASCRFFCVCSRRSDQGDCETKE